jgi:hypothetical protein
MDVREPHYRIGHWLAVCDRCGVTKWNDGLRLEWTGLRVCGKCWEPRHPQEYVQGVKDDQAPDWARPKQDGPDISIGSGNEVSADDL